MRGFLRVLALAALCASAATACKGDKSVKPELPPPAVIVALAAKSSVSPADEFIGQTKAEDLVDLTARIQGFLVKRNFSEGQMVKSGDVLLQIEKEQYLAAVEKAKGSLAALAAKCKNAEVEYQRQETLWKQGVSSQKEYDNALYSKLSAEADVAETDASLKIAQLNLSYADIKAPFDGIVGLCKYSVGNLVGPDSGKLATVVRLDPMRVEFNIDELDVLRYCIKAAGARAKLEAAPDISKYVVRVKFQNGQIYEREGRITYSDNHINSSTGTMLVQAQFPNPEYVLSAGMYVKVLISEREKVEKLLIPSRAVLENQSGDYVFVVDSDSKIAIRGVKKGAAFGKLVSIEAGLSDGEKVVVEGVQKVRPGVKVEAKELKLDFATAAAEAAR